MENKKIQTEKNENAGASAGVVPNGNNLENDLRKECENLEELKRASSQVIEQQLAAGNQDGAGGSKTTFSAVVNKLPEVINPTVHLSTGVSLLALLMLASEQKLYLSQTDELSDVIITKKQDSLE